MACDAPFTPITSRLEHADGKTNPFNIHSIVFDGKLVVACFASTGIKPPQLATVSTLVIGFKIKKVAQLLMLPDVT